MFIWSIPAILSAFTRHAARAGDASSSSITAPTDPRSAGARGFPKLPKISIDYAVMEKAARVLVVEAGFDWDDVGGWLAVAEYLPDDAAQNRGNTHAISSRRCERQYRLLGSADAVGLLGVRDLIVVRTGDACWCAIASRRRRSRRWWRNCRLASVAAARMKALGIDLGAARIGLALADDLGMLAHPLETIVVKDVPNPLARIRREWCAREKITAVVLGLPRNMDGSYGARRGKDARLCREAPGADRLPGASSGMSGSPPSRRSARCTRPAAT